MMGSRTVAGVIKAFKTDMTVKTFERHGITLGTITRRLPLVDACGAIERFNRSKGTSLRLISPAVADRLLLDPDVCMFLGPSGRFLTDSIVAYPAPGAPLGQTVQFKSEKEVIFMHNKVSLPTNTALLLTGLAAADFVVDGTTTVRADKQRLSVIRKFPQSLGYYRAEREPWIPNGVFLGGLSASVERKEGVHRIIRAVNPSYIGPMTRDARPEQGDITIMMATPWSSPYSLVLEIPEKDAAKFAGRR